MYDDFTDVYIAIGCIILVIVGSIGYAFVYADSATNATITIDAKDIKYHGGDAKYLIHSTTGEVFEITDTYTFWRFNSSDMYFSLEEGKTYECKIWMALAIYVMV